MVFPFVVFISSPEKASSPSNQESSALMMYDLPDKYSKKGKKT